MIAIYKKMVKDEKLVMLPEFKAGTWIHAEDPTPEELDRLSEMGGLERDLLFDALDPNEIPRVESSESVTYVYTRVPAEENGRETTHTMLAAIGPDFVLTFSQKPLPFIQKFTNEKISFSTTQKTKLFAQIFTQINLTYQSHQGKIAKTARKMAREAEEIQNEDILELIKYERILDEFLSALVPTNALLKSLLGGRHFPLYEEDKDLIEDLILANGQIVETCKSNLRHIANTREAYSTIITNNLNRVIKLLTSLTVVINVPILVTGLFGMNVGLPLADAPHAFATVGGIALVLSIIALAIFAKKKWLL
ncbi:magnesium transporter CorA family protein [bacterium]|nr:magnesium transporter CorA family protein [bacterium]MCI0565700.1 magnesium transporter CorA family protein [bacterium]MCI0680010.1 magnesium transporter CorA family protein [bacterium]